MPTQPDRLILNDCLVEWQNGRIESYFSTGIELAEIEVVTPVGKGFYQPDMFPILRSPFDSPLTPGDWVMISVNLKHLRTIQNQNGGWDPRLSEVCGVFIELLSQHLGTVY